MKTLKIINKAFATTAMTLILTASFFSQSVFAGTNSPGIDQKQQNQKGRIFQGVNSGELTGKEAWRLGKQQGKIYRKENHFKADGNFTRRERAVIHHDLLKSSGSIYKKKHDRQVQGQDKGKGAKHVGINKRQQKQQRRIGQGVRSGALTGREAAKLGHQQARIQHKKRHFKADGNFTKRERAKIRSSQNRASKNIYRKKHNAKRR